MFDFPIWFVLVPLTFWWWTFLVVVSGLFFWAIDDDETIGGTIALTVFACLAYVVLGPGAEAIGWAFGHPLHILAGVALYMLIGTGWCVLKWMAHVKKVLATYRRLVSTYEPGGTYNTLESYIQSRWRYSSRQVDGVTVFRPYAADNKQRIATWVIYWPLSLVWTAIRDWIVAVTEAIYNAIGDWLDAISKRMWGDE